MKAKVIVIANQKGGVVKSMSTNEIGYNLAKAGNKVLEIDMDWTAGSTERKFPNGMPLEIETDPAGRNFSPGPAHTYQLFMSGSVIAPIDLKDGRHFIGTTSDLNDINYRPQDVIFDFRDNINELIEEYDYIIIDSNPSYSNVMIASHLVADYLIIPTLLEKSARNGVAKQLAFMQKIKKNYNPKLQLLGCYITQGEVVSYKKDLFADRETSIEFQGRLTVVDTLNLEVLIEILNDYQYPEDKILAIIPASKTLAKEALELGITFREHAPGSVQDSEYQMLTNKLMTLIEEFEGANHG